MDLNTNEVFGWAAASISTILHFNQILEYIKLCKGKIRYIDAPNLNAFIKYMICINWLIYAYLLKNKHIFIAYLVGSIFSIICVSIFLVILSKIKLIKSFLLACILFAYTLLSYLLFALLIKDIDIVGCFCVGSSFFLLFQPFNVIKKAIKYRNYKYIPIILCLFSLVGAICWVIYGFMIINFYVIIPNFIDMVSSLIMMFIWNIFKKKRPFVDEVANSSMNGSKIRAENSVTIT